jgi:hypothetical protein
LGIAAAFFHEEPVVGAMAGIARNIEVYNLAYSLAWKHISALQRREQNIARRLHDSIRRQLHEGATEPLSIASEALKDVDVGKGAGKRLGGLLRHFNLNAVGRVADDDSGKQRHPLLGFVLGDLLTVANYKKTLAVRFRSVVRFRP